MLLVAGLIHLIPLWGALGGEQLTELYGVPLSEPNLIILMRHRAVLLGFLGMFFVVAAFVRPLRGLALVAGFVTVVPFLGLVESVDDYNAQLGRVFLADVVALICLIVATAAHFYERHKGE